MIATTKFILGVIMICSTIVDVTRAVEGGLRSSSSSEPASSSSSSPSYRRHLLEDDQECVLYKAEVRYGTGEDGDPFTDEIFWACEFPRNMNSRASSSRSGINVFGEREHMIRIEGLSNEDIESKHGAVSGESVMKAKDMVVEENLGNMETKLRVTDPAIEPLSHVDPRHSRNRKLAAERKLKMGTYETLVVRVIDSENRVVDIDADDLSEDIFTAEVSLGKHYAECSADKFKIVPSSDGKGTGVVDIKVNAKESSATLESAAWAKAGELYGGSTGLRNKYDLVMLCLPPETGSWVAYAYINHYVSVYNDKWCSKVSAQMHEVGHNLGLAHSGQHGNSYDDQTGLMGYSYWQDNGPKMCFNPQKSYQLGWYDDQVDTFDPPAEGAGSYEYTLNGAADYKKNTNSLVSLRLLTDGWADYYAGYNRAVGANSETQEAPNSVVILKKQKGGVAGYGESDLVAVLGSSGSSWSVGNWTGSGLDVTVTVDGAIGADVRDAKIVVKVCPPGGCTQAPSLPECKDKKGKIKFVKGGKPKKWNCKKIKQKKVCHKTNKSGKYLWESCPIKCEGKYDAKLLTTCRVL